MEFTGKYVVGKTKSDNFKGPGENSDFFYTDIKQGVYNKTTFDFLVLTRNIFWINALEMRLKW